MTDRYVELPEVREKLRPVLGKDAEGVMFEPDGDWLMVNWPQSQLLGRAEQEQVKQVVAENLPQRLRGMRISIT